MAQGALQLTMAILLDHTNYKLLFAVNGYINTQHNLGGCHPIINTATVVLGTTTTTEQHHLIFGCINNL